MNKKDFVIFSLLLFAVSLVFTLSTVYLLLAFLGAWLLQQVFFKRNLMVLLLLASAGLSLIVFDYAGGKILQKRMAKEYFASLDHYPRPDSKKGYNEDGIRTYLNRPAGQFAAADFNMVFLGDSFTQGYMVPKEDSFPFRLGELLEKADPGLRFNIANFGWISSSPLLSLRRLEKIGGKYHPDLVLLCLDMTDFHDDSKYRDQLENPRQFSPFTFFLYRFQLAPLWAEFKKGLRFSAQEPLVPEQRYFILNQPLEKSRKYLFEIEKNIRAIDVFCRENLQAKFVLIMLPRNIQYNARETPDNKLEPGEYTPMGPYVFEPFVWLEEFKKKVHFPVFSLLEDFKNCQVFPTCFETDPHWNRQGHAVAAQGVMEILKKLAAENYIDLALAAKKQ
jgi:hypothetical protein